MRKLLVFFFLLVLIIPAFGAVKKAEPEPKPRPKVVAATPEAIARKAIDFKDLKATHPAYSYVMKMVVSYEVISGYPDNTFRGDKTITRAEFSKVITNALTYLERKYDIPLTEEPTTKEVDFKDLKSKHWAYPYVANLVTKYRIITGYPDGTFKPGKTINRFELATVLAKTLKLIYERYEMELPKVTEVRVKDVKPKHWAMPDIQLLLLLGIMESYQDKTFKGTKSVTRFEVAVSGAKLIDNSETAIAKLPSEKLRALRKKYGVPEVVKVLPPPPSRVEKALEITTKPVAYISGGWGNVYESASGTNNMGFNASASYGDVFSIWMLSGNYELTGKYGFNQVVYLVPAGGGRVSGGTNNENRYELELSTIYPIVQLWGISGKLLLGAKYLNLSNPTAPTNFTGFNAGLVTGAKVFDRNFLLRAFYSLPLVRPQLSPSVLGQPAQLFDYEASLDAEIFSYPILFGFSGELMTLSGGGARYYSNFFVRYYLF